MNIASSYLKGAFLFYAVNKLEAPFLKSIEVERAALATFRCSLKADFKGQVKKAFSYSYELFLTIPVVRTIFHLANRFFSPPPSPLDSLWDKQELGPLIDRLEAQVKTGITWYPKTTFKQTPPLPSSIGSIRKFARDLTQDAATGRLRPFFGRKEEIREAAIILGRNQKSNPILIGEPGVGKTAIPHGIAQSIVDDREDLPLIFRGKRIFLLDWALLNKGAEKYGKDTVESRLLAILNEASSQKDIILFIDEIHAFLDKKSDSVFANILKPALADGSFSCIGATTPWDYENLLSIDPALERRFPQVRVKEPPKQEIRKLLHFIKPQLEGHHGVRISDEAIDECISLGARYLKSESFPDKAIDLLDQATSQLSLSTPCNPEEKPLAVFLKLLVTMRRLAKDPTLIDEKIAEIGGKFTRVVNEDKIREVVARKVELPLQKIQESERDMLSHLEESLAKKIIGQKDAIKLLCQGVRRSRLRLGGPDRPAGVFLMLGSTGVGKTASAEALCEILYGSKEMMLRLDMSEYQSAHDASKLIGSPPGYTGHGKGGKLTNWLQKKPNSIVLLDEIEKASPEIFDLFLQVFDAGRLTDGEGKTVRCHDTTFILTSNIGSRYILEHPATSPVETLWEKINEKLSRFFRIEFLNRIQEMALFQPLTEDEIRQIALLQCEEFKERVRGNPQIPKLSVEWDESLINFLIQYGYNKSKGARELSRCIMRNMENPLADAIVLEKLQEGDIAKFTSDGRRVSFSIVRSLPN